MILLVIIPISGTACKPGITKDSSFNGDRAYQDVVFQVEQGPRIPGEPGHQRVREWIITELEAHGWNVEIQQIIYQGKEIHNLIAYRDRGEDYILLGAHYDTRIHADLDPDKTLREEPVPGANDGGSGVAVLLEIARTLPHEFEEPIRLVFFDAEDNGGIEDWEWIMGSRAFVENYPELPQTVVIVDMVGDTELNLYYERNSDPYLTERIWTLALKQGYETIFIPEYRHSVIDDHTPFVEVGIPAVDIIDLDYPYWHTTADTLDKVSPDSLEAVGTTLLAWLLILD